MVKVIDLSSVNDFEKECRSFKTQVDKVFEPDMVVGIATGGEYVVKAMGYEEEKILIVKRQRRSTGVKKKLGFSRLLKPMPIFFKNSARRLEVFFREVLFSLSGRQLEQGVVEGLENVSFDSGGQAILVVDDAVDSGATFNDVVKCINVLSPESKVFTASMSQTFRSPAYPVDFVFHCRAIVRGPWAFDSRMIKQES